MAQRFQFPKKWVFSENSTLGARRGLEGPARAPLRGVPDATPRESGQRGGGLSSHRAVDVDRSAGAPR